MVWDIDELNRQINYSDFYSGEIDKFQIRNSEWATGLCPFHDDTRPSLSINLSRGIYYCFACGEKGNVYAFYMKRYDKEYKEALKYFAERYGVEKKKRKEERRIIATYDYTNENGELIFQVVRCEPKTFFQRRKDLNGKWVNNLDGVTPIIYNLKSVIESELIFVVEGEKDVETLKSIGLIATCNPMGAGKWREEYNEYLKNKTVIIIPDNDEPGFKHAYKVAKSLLGVAKEIRVLMLPVDKRGDITDYVMNMFEEGKSDEEIKNTILEISSSAQSAESFIKEIEISSDGEPPEEDKEEPRYIWDGKALWVSKETKHGTAYVKLCNFKGKIIKRIEFDNGEEILLSYEIEAEGYKFGEAWKHKIITKSSNIFEPMKYMKDIAEFIEVEPGQTIKDHVRHSIEYFTKEKPEIERIYIHTGWAREILEDGTENWFYITQNGAVGKNGVTVELPLRNKNVYVLPVGKISDEEIIEGIKTSLKFIDLGRKEITVSIWLYTYLSVITTLVSPIPSFVIFLYGKTGSFKTTLSNLLLSHFGDLKDFEAGGGVSHFEDTPNSIEKRGFDLKDTLLLIDDYCPKTTGREYQDRTLQRIVRNYGNRTGRQRLTRESTEKVMYAPRGLALITGEDLMDTESALARMLVISIKHGDIDANKLTRLQNLSYRLPYAMRGFLDYVRANMGEIRANYGIYFQEERNIGNKLFGSIYSHRRYIDCFAHICTMSRIISDWLLKIGVFDEEERQKFTAMTKGVMYSLIRDESKSLEESNEVEKFYEAINMLLATKQIYMYNKDNGQNTFYIDDIDDPYKKEELLLEKEKVKTTADQDIKNSTFVGWYDKDYFYFLLGKKETLIFKEIIKYYRDRHEPFPVSERTLRKRLDEAGVLKKNSPTHYTYIIRVSNKLKRTLAVRRQIKEEDSEELEE